MYKRILVPLDGSQLAENVLPVVESIARGIKSKVSLLSVVDIEGVADELPILGSDSEKRLRREARRAGEAGWGGGRSRSSFSDSPSRPSRKGGLATLDFSRSIDQVGQNATTVANDYLKKVAATIDLPKGNVSYSAILAKAAEAIVKESEKQPGTMIAMSTHGRSGFQRLYLGSVADKVLHTANVPLLLYSPHSVVGITATRHLNRIIVPLDGTSASEDAMPHAEVLAKTLDLKIVLVRVVPTFLIQSNDWYQTNIPDWSLIEFQKDAKLYLDNIAMHLAERGFKDVDARVELGGPANIIVGIAQSSPGALIAMSSRARPGIGHLGSVTEKVVRSADVPTFIIPPGRGK